MYYTHTQKHTHILTHAKTINLLVKDGDPQEFVKL